MTKVNANKSVESQNPHWVEWVTGIVCAAVVLAVIGWIGKDALTDRDTSPDLVGSVSKVEKRSDGFQVSFEIRNRSSRTASKVRVQGEVTDATGVVETAETVVDYVPGRSTAKGGFVFGTDPQGKTVSVRTIAFNDP